MSEKILNEEDWEAFQLVYHKWMELRYVYSYSDCEVVWREAIKNAKKQLKEIEL